MDLGIAGRTALVTASSKGLGRASALALAAEGANVAICARGQAALSEAEAAIKDTGAEVLALVEDVTTPDAPARLVAATAERFGSLDILVANAGGPPPGRAFEVDDDALIAALNANLMASIRLVRESLPWMKRRGWGRVCLITSYTIKQPVATLSLSNTARAGLWAWAKTAAEDVFADGITINLICPGPHATDRMTQLGGDPATMGDPANFGRIVAFLCSEPAAFMTGSTVNVDGATLHGLI